MLLQFRAKNHLSLRDRQTLSLVASSLRDTEVGLIGSSSQAKTLPAAIIYGANASGKSNIVDAIEFMRTAVLRSHREGTPGGGVPRTPFALDKTCRKEQSTFEADFVFEGTRYNYGFAARDDAFTGEWLHAFPTGRRQVLFERDRQTFTFGRSLRGRNKIISELTRPNSLFVSTAAQNDHEDLLKITQFFQSVIVHRNVEDSDRYFPDPKEDLSRVIAFLSEIGTGVDGYRMTETEFADDVREALMAFSSVIASKNKTRSDFKIPDKLPSIQLSHPSVDGEPVFFDLDAESMGTKRLLSLLRPALRVLEQGGILVIDEIDASLHTKACEAVIALFSFSVKNVAGAQLIATTHDTNLLRSAFLRRDQIWFTEKEPNGATHLYPLSDFHTRQGDNIEKGYLQGRYGAIPFAGAPDELISKL